MHEREKIEESKYFHSRMIKEYENIEHFRHNLSAFLSAGRSVLEYARKEARTKRKGLKWYDDWMKASPILRFFKNKRIINFHSEPINLRKDIEVAIRETVHLSESVSVKITRADGKTESKSIPIETKQKPEKSKSSVESKTTYRFDDWMKYCQSNNLKDFTGNEDVLILCERYIQEFEKAVKDGVSKGFITG